MKCKIDPQVASHVSTFNVNEQACIVSMYVADSLTTHRSNEIKVLVMSPDLVVSCDGYDEEMFWFSNFDVYIPTTLNKTQNAIGIALPSDLSIKELSKADPKYKAIKHLREDTNFINGDERWIYECLSVINGSSEINSLIKKLLKHTVVPIDPKLVEYYGDEGDFLIHNDYVNDDKVEFDNFSKIEDTQWYSDITKLFRGAPYLAYSTYPIPYSGLDLREYTWQYDDEAIPLDFNPYIEYEFDVLFKEIEMYSHIKTHSNASKWLCSKLPYDIATKLGG